MRKSIFLILILGELILTGFSPRNKRENIDPSNKDVFITGKISFKKEKLPPIKFWIEGDDGSYSVIIYNESSYPHNLKKVAKIVTKVFSENVSDSTNSYVFHYKGIDYSIIDFDNKKTNNLNGFKLIPLGLRVVKEIEAETRGKASGHVVW